VISRGVYPRIEIGYKSWRAKAYFNKERACASKRRSTTPAEEDAQRLELGGAAPHWHPEQTLASSPPSASTSAACRTAPP
jgi:hypothetical protein